MRPFLFLRPPTLSLFPKYKCNENISWIGTDLLILAGDLIYKFHRNSNIIQRKEADLKAHFILTRPKIGLKWCASCGSFALSTISIVLSPADWYLNTFSFVIFLPDVSDNTINQHSPVEMQCNLLMSFHLMNPFPIRILFFPIINNHVSPKRSILRHPALLSVCVNDHRPTFISR